MSRASRAEVAGRDAWTLRWRISREYYPASAGDLNIDDAGGNRNSLGAIFHKTGFVEFHGNACAIRTLCRRDRRADMALPPAFGSTAAR